MTRSRAKRFLHRRSKRGISEAVSTIVLIAVSVVIGLVAWAWAQGSAVSSENNYNNVVFEKFSIAASKFPSSTSVQLWIYDSGSTNATITALLLNSSQIAGFTPITITPGTLKPTAVLTIPATHTGSLQTFKAIGKYGTVYTYLVVS